MSEVYEVQINDLHFKVYYDENCENPYECDEGVHIVVLHRRLIDPSQGACGSTPEQVQAWVKENKEEWFAIPLFMYDHSGQVYRASWVNPFHCPWDSGQVGIIALKRSEWGDGNESDAKLTEYAQGTAKHYGEWANGECFGYVAYNSDGEEVDSCYGFIGQDIEEAMKEVAAP